MGRRRSCHTHLPYAQGAILLLAKARPRPSRNHNLPAAANLPEVAPCIGALVQVGSA